MTKGEKNMIWYFLTFAFGTMFGLFLTALLTASRDEDIVF